MDNVINNLIEIDKKARLIVEEAEMKSKEIINSIVLSQKDFEVRYDDKAKIRLNKVREEESKKVSEQCRKIQDKYDTLIEKLEQRYLKNHEEVENKILKNILGKN